MSSQYTVLSSPLGQFTLQDSYISPEQELVPSVENSDPPEENSIIGHWRLPVGETVKIKIIW